LPAPIASVTDGRLDDVGVRPQRRELVGMAEQRERAEGDHVRRCVKAGSEQEGADARELVVVQVGLGQAAEDVLGRVGALGSYQTQQVLVERAHGRAHRLERAAVAGHREHVALEGVAVRVGHAEQLADDERGERPREGGHEVGRRSVTLHRVDVLGGDLLHPLGERPHAAHREVADERAAQAGVLGRVDPREVTDGGRR
jgi:hypothetical protein